MCEKWNIGVDGMSSWENFGRRLALGGRLGQRTWDEEGKKRKRKERKKENKSGVEGEKDGREFTFMHEFSFMRE